MKKLLFLLMIGLTTFSQPPVKRKATVPADMILMGPSKTLEAEFDLGSVKYTLYRDGTWKKIKR